MSTNHIFIVIEGVDGVGKTTVARYLAANGSFLYYKTPSGPFQQLRREIDKHSTPLERYCFYRLAIQYDSEQIRQLLKKNSVVCDRYIFSTAAYHIAMDQRIQLIYDDNGIIKPHFAFLLDARPEIRNRRLLNRKRTSSDIQIERDSTLLNRVREIFKTFGLIYIDTSDMTVKEVADKIMYIITKGEIK